MYTRLLFSLFFLVRVFYSYAQMDSIEINPSELTINSLLKSHPSEDSIKKWLQSIDSKVKLTYNPKVAGFIDYFTKKNRDYTQLMIQRKNLYFTLFEDQLAKYNLPDELKYLSIVESGLNPKAISRAKASGLWQFMPGTGKIFKLQQDYYIDERMDPIKSTEAACLYLRQLYTMFNDWELAIAAYNCGPGVVKKALKKSTKKGFWDIYAKLPRETRSYLPQFIAVTYAMNFSDAHALTHDQLEYSMETDTVVLSGFVNLEVFSRMSGICYDDFTKINPALKQKFLPDYIKGYPVYVPSDRKEFITGNRKIVMDSASKINKKELIALASTTQKKVKTYYTIKKGENLSTIAKKFNVQLSSLAKWNNLKTNTLKEGQKLVIWNSIAVKNSIPKKTTPDASINPSSAIHIVQQGDSLWTIAKKYALTIEKLKKLNNLKDNNIHPGQKLIVG